MRPITVDTGGPDDVFLGARVVWMHTPRDGYGFSMQVEAEVVAFTLRPGTRVRIRVTRKDGEKVVRTVDAKHLRWHQ